MLPVLNPVEDAVTAGGAMARSGADAIDASAPSTHARAAAAASGDMPTLLACFLHFDLSFMLWVLFGALGIFIAESAGLTASQKGLLVAIPLLSGSLLRVPAGWLSDRLGGKRVGVILLAGLYVPLTLGWLAGGSWSTLLLAGLMLGSAGASFAVALPLASRWYPPERQGLAMGIAAAGNSGTVITNLLAPRLAVAIGWQNVLGVAMIPLTLVLLAFVWLAKDHPARPARRSIPQTFAAVAHRDLWWFCLFYSVTFGGYVGLTSFLPLFLRDQYGMATLTAGQATALVALMGSASRPFGGYLADRVGGVRMLLVALAGIGVTYGLASRLPPASLMLGLLFVGMACLGLGNGAVFQLVPQRFRQEIGIVTGIVGAIGGLGGFFLPTLLGFVKQSTGSFSSAFVVLALVALGAAVSLRALSVGDGGWRRAWR
jgi:NNP family nitrate/nitrite transporter-like MFS transporter